MRIVFVAEPYEEREASGMGYVILEFMRNLARQVSHDDELVVYSRSAVNRDFIGPRAQNHILPRGWLNKLWYFYRFPDECDTLVFMAPMLPLLIPKRIKAVMLCQDVASLQSPPKGQEALFAFVRDRVLMPLSIRRALRVVVPSQATKDDLIHFYGTPAHKIVVIPDGYQQLKSYAPGEPLEPGLKPFFFFTGKVKARKNVHGIVSAFIAFKEHMHSDCKLVIGGSFGGEYYERMRRQIEAHGLSDAVIFAGYVSIQKLYSFYTQALALVFPSFAEGFGMPIAEAMSLGTPVITSNISSMPEVAGDAALLVDPNNIQDISRAMERIYKDAGLRESLIRKGYQRAAHFSWETSGKELLSLLYTL